MLFQQKLEKGTREMSQHIFAISIYFKGASRAPGTVNTQRIWFNREIN